MSGSMIDKATLRAALGTFATGVTIVTTRDAQGRPVGLTASSFNSVSLDPPLVLWSLALNSPNLAAFRTAKVWAVHVLGADQETLSARFAKSGAAKFEGVEITAGPSEVPLLDGCAARFVCRATFEHEGGDHAIFVGEVIDLTTTALPPLVFHGGSYGRMVPRSKTALPSAFADEGEFSRFFIGHALGKAHRSVFSEVAREYRRRGWRASDYTVMAALGLGEGCTRLALIDRAARGGVTLPEDAIDRLIAASMVAMQDETLLLTSSGRHLLAELMAVAQAAQLKVESKLSSQEMQHLYDMLVRISDH